MTIPDRALLERNRLFRDILIENVGHILEDCQAIALKSGATLLEAGQKNASLYLVMDGELRVYLNGPWSPAHAVLGPGECVGELSLIDGGSSAALVMAAQDTRLLEVPHEQVWAMVDGSNGIARNLLAILAGRIRNDNLLQVTTPDNSLEFEVAANVDTLTGLHNRNWLNEAFRRMVQRCERGGMPLFLMLADIDRFKDYSDRHGRLAGDNALKGVARILALNLRPHDLLVYMGGDRFAVLLAEKLADDVMKMAERLHEAVAASALRIHAAGDPEAIREGRVTISIGIRTVQRGAVLAETLAAAGEALCQAKADGGNRVIMAAAHS